MDTLNIKDIAKICGVGVSTVSRAINNHPDINEETKNRILEVIRENHYIPNNSARNLKRSVSKTIAVLIKGIDNPFFYSMIRIFEEEIQKKRYSFLLHRVEEAEDEVDVAIELIKEKRLKGIIFLGGHFCQNKEKLKQLEIPFVLSTASCTGAMENEFLSCVSVDDFQESYKIVDYLCSLGHGQIGILAATPQDESIGCLRLEGYRRALADHGIQSEPSWCFYSPENVNWYTMANGYGLMKKLMASKPELTAVFAISDSMAIGACKAVFDAGKSVPKDYSIAGFDGLDMAHYYNPAITTIHQPVEEMAYETIRILFAQIRSKNPEQRVSQQKIFQARLVEGQSTKSIETENH